MVKNPFVTIGYSGPEYFCDRKNETEKILQHLENGWNITLFSPRKMGKTGLIHHVFHHLQGADDGPVCIYLDIYATSQLSEFVALFAKAVFSSIGSPVSKIVQKIKGVFSSIRPIITLDEMTGKPIISIDFAPSQTEQALGEIFKYIASIGKDCYVAIDEFQQILYYPEKNVEALLRTYIQEIPKVRFIFAGSKNHLMELMFVTARRPFFQSTRLLALNTIEKAFYYEFAKPFFDKRNIALSENAFEELYSLVYGHTWYVQSILNQLYADKPKEVNHVSILAAVNEVVEENTSTYQRFFSMLTCNQRMMLKAISKERIVEQPTASRFLSRYGLKSGSSATRAISSLLENEYLYRDERGLIVYDHFFGIWLSGQ